MSPRRARAALLALSLAIASILNDPAVSGQALPPRSAVAVTRLPSLAFRPIPADFNRDGRTDLVAGRPFAGNPQTGGELVLALGNGDGTFSAPQPIATPSAAAMPLAVGDFNTDGAVDIVAMDNAPRTLGEQARNVWILPGAGNGTFGAAIAVGSVGIGSEFFIPPPAAVVDDFNGDSRLDLAVISHPNTVFIYPGNGDFSFSARVALSTGAVPNGLAAGDVNGDGRRDIVVAARDGQQVDVFVNQGGLSFGLSVIPVGREALDVAIADLNRDGAADLLVAAARENVDYRGTFHDGHVFVMAGNGNGTFRSPAAHSVPNGPVAILAADFNRDGLTDVLTANRTGGVQEDCGPMWDSVTVLPGDAAGALGPAQSFQPSYDTAEPFTPRESILAARLDADEHPDLVTETAILFNRPAAPNRAPTATAGPDQPTNHYLQAQASDPDYDRLTFSWTDPGGRRIETCLQPYIAVGPGDHEFTLVVEDGRGGVATDTVIVSNASTTSGPGLDLIRPSFDRPVLSGAPYVIQFRTFDRDGEVVDVDISVDQNGQNNFTPIPACTNMSGAATECVWSNPGPPSNSASLLFRITDSQGNVNNLVAIFQIVASPHGAMPPGWANADVGAVGAAGGAGFDGVAFTIRGSGADIWGTADEFHWAFTSVTGDFAIVARAANVQNINPWTKAGLMIRESQAAGARHASIFATPGTTKPISFQRRPETNGISVHTGGAIAAPPAWLMLRRAGDVISSFYRTTAAGDWIALGTQTLTGLAATVQVGLPMSSHVDGTLATVTFDAVDIMRAASGPLTVLRPSAGEQVQVNAPLVIRWLPQGDASDIVRFDAFFAQSAEGPFTRISECSSVPADKRWCVWGRPGPTGAGFIRVVATTNTGSQRTAMSAAFEVVARASGDSGMPPGWSCGDAGAVSAPGSCAYSFEDELVPDFIVRGSGADIWGTADEFSFARYAAYGDFTMTARVLQVSNVNRWTKAGIMIRDWDGRGTAPAGSRHASFFVTPSLEKGTAFQRRPATGGESIHTAGPVTTAPVWVKLVRAGDTIRAYYRINRTDAWAFLGEQTFAGLPYELSAMLVVSSHVDGTVAEARFDEVSVLDRQPMQSADIGGAVPGTTSATDVETTIEGNGADIWGTADAFRFHYVPWDGNGYVIARVRSLEATHAWAKAGVMFRETLQPQARHVMAIVSPSRGAAMQYRTSQGDISFSTAPIAANAPGWLAMRRFGDTFTASWSTDGETWHFIGSVTIPMFTRVFVGLPVTSHVNGTLATAVFDDVVIWHSPR